MSVPNPLYSHTPPVSVPGNGISPYNASWVNNYIQTLVNQGSFVSGVNSFIHGFTFTSFASYAGGVYSPTQNRIYLVPYDQAPIATWHYIDCNTGNVVAYANGLTLANVGVNGAYIGGVYAPTQNRIYFVPAAQSTNPVWHYINCSSETVVPYAHATGITVLNAYSGGCFSPTQNRIYFAPRRQGGDVSAVWHYIDCSVNIVTAPPGPSGLVVSYSRGSSLIVSSANDAYIGAVYSPTENKIYFVPNVQAEPFPGNANTQFWHYIDCNATGNAVTVVTYLNPNNAVSSAYYGGAYSPTQNRIYFCPYNQGAPANLSWHYINCNTGTLVSYLNGVTLTNGPNYYAGAVYSPVNNRIYLVPYNQHASSTWHYIDCNTGAVVGYAKGLSVAAQNFLGGGFYSPVQNRIYFSTNSQTILYFLDIQSNASTSKVMMANATYNKL